jgi:hypothetical protein
MILSPLISGGKKLMPAALGHAGSVFIHYLYIFVQLLYSLKTPCTGKLT